MPTATERAPTPVVAKEPPEPVEEVLPEMKPTQGNVVWISGYWSWDADAEEFLWISGVWRAVPPGRTWIPGSWQKVSEGWQWSSGYWGIPGKTETEYLPEPKASLETGPSSPAPDANATYVPGNWVYRGVNAGYAWKVGFWVAYRAGWVWIPASYRKTPAGYVYVPGHWDLPLLSRGLLFAPVRFVNVRGKKIAYRPTYVIEMDFLLGALFVSNGSRMFYFGNYFDTRYLTSYVFWTQYQPVKNVTVQDTTYTYYKVTHVKNKYPAWERNLIKLYERRREGVIARPPNTLHHQKKALAKHSESKNNEVVSEDIPLSHVENLRVMQSITDVHSFEVSFLQPLATGKPSSTKTKYDRNFMNIESLAGKRIAGEKQRIEQQIERYKIIAQTRAEAEAKLVAEGSELKEPVQIRWELPKGTPREHHFLTPPFFPKDRPDDTKLPVLTGPGAGPGGNGRLVGTQVILGKVKGKGKKKKDK